MADQDEFSERERLFVHAFVGEAAGNASRAAVIAGYSAKSARRIGHRLSTRVHIQQAINAHQQAVATRSALNVDQWHAEVDRIALTKTDKVTTAEKLKALELKGKASGYIRDKPQGSRIIVNIGFLSEPGEPPLVIDTTPKS